MNAMLYGTASFLTFILVGKRLHCYEVGCTAFRDVKSRCFVDSYGGFRGVSETFRRDILSLYSTLKIEAVSSPECVLSSSTICTTQYYKKS